MIKVKHKKHKSIYKRTALAAFASVMVAFSILSFVYYGIMNERVNRLQIEKLYTIGTTIKNEIEAAYNGDNLMGEKMAQMAINQRIDLLAKSSDSFIWLVREDGIMIHASSIPGPVLANSQNLGGGIIRLSPDYLPKMPLMDDGEVLTIRDTISAFSEDKIEWLTLYLPIKAHREDIKPDGVLQIYLKSYNRYNLRWFVTNGVGLAFLVALIISVALSLLLMNYLALPLEALVNAAKKVMLGDYSVRIKYSDINSISNQDSIEETDDVTRLMLTFNAMVARLDAVTAEQRDMISSISHDMKTPLTSIIGFTDGILDGTVPADKQDKYLKIIQQEAIRLKILLADMNEENVIDNHSNSSNFTNFNINHIFISTIESLENQLLAKNLAVEIQFDSSDDGRLMVTGDEVQIGRVVYNLVSNATKFCKDGDVIRVSTSYPEGALYVSCSVEDSGPGIPPDKRNDVFGRFYKLDKSRGNREGSGLGLYICRKILANHGQQIYAAKSLDLGGAKFVFTLPAGANQRPGKSFKDKKGSWMVFGRKNNKKDGETNLGK